MYALLNSNIMVTVCKWYCCNDVNAWALNFKFHELFVDFYFNFFENSKKKAEEEMKKEVLKKKKDTGLLGSLLQQATGNAEKGGLEFSLANLFKCMCFTHEDPEDPKKQLVKVNGITMYNFHNSTDIFVNPSFLQFCTQKAPWISSKNRYLGTKSCK